MLKYIKDSRGNYPSILIVIVVLWIAFTVALFTHTITYTDYTTMVGAILVGWLGVEYIKRKKR